MYEGNLLCLLCDTKSEETQEHLLLCPSILSEVVVDKSVEYMDIFDPLEKQIKAVNYFSQIISTRKVIMKELAVLSRGKP